MTPDLPNLLREIIHQTEQGKLEWKFVSDNNARLNVGEDALVLEYDEAYTPDEAVPSEERVWVWLYDKTGEMVEMVSSRNLEIEAPNSFAEGWHQKLKKMFFLLKNEHSESKKVVTRMLAGLKRDSR